MFTKLYCGLFLALLSTVWCVDPAGARDLELVPKPANNALGHRETLGVLGERGLKGSIPSIAEYPVVPLELQEQQVQWNGVARLHLFVPPDAEVNIANRQTSSRGAYRLYELTRLPPRGRRKFEIRVTLPYSYTFWAQTIQVSAREEIELRVRDIDLLAMAGANTIVESAVVPASVTAAETDAPAALPAPNPVADSNVDDPATITRIFTFEAAPALPTPPKILSAQIDYDENLRAKKIVFDGRTPPPVDLSLIDKTDWKGTRVSFDATLTFTLTAKPAGSDDFSIKFETPGKTESLEFKNANETKTTTFEDVKLWINETLKGEVESGGGVFKSHRIEQLKLTRKFKIGKLELEDDSIKIQVLR